ncbi:MAG: hypothetical protein NT091_04160, partial [Candidatus Falkowbacteria bacterium]|nr:hypothetical protein [Candidatus Falkowbacteria bacterium]
IIGLLSTLAVVALNNARTKSRDARRVSDIRQVQSALELYFNDRNGYPIDSNLTNGDIGNKCLSTAGFDTCSGTTYMTKVPANPEPGGSSYVYTNTDSTSARKYSLQYQLEAGTGGIGAGYQTATQAGMSK